MVIEHLPQTKRYQFESSTLTYQVEVLVQHQGSVSDKHTFNKIDTENPTKKYGDRFISGTVIGAPESVA